MLREGLKDSVDISNNSHTSKDTNKTRVSWLCVKPTNLGLLAEMALLVLRSLKKYIIKGFLV